MIHILSMVNKFNQIWEMEATTLLSLILSVLGMVKNSTKGEFTHLKLIYKVRLKLLVIKAESLFSLNENK